jgi:phosphate acetyltransferase
MKKKAVFMAATGQNVGKTTLCLGILAGLRKRYNRVGFFKPVGQELVSLSEGYDIDKDAVLFKDYFSLSSSYSAMNPVQCHSKFTRYFLDGKIDEASIFDQIRDAWKVQQEANEFMLVEGTGHVGVGSLFNLNNAQVAKGLDVDVVIVATGGIGSAFDELALNIEMCRYHGIKIKGIILNKVLDEKREMILDYFPKALKRWNIPLIGCVPYVPLLSKPSMRDFEVLLKSPLLCGEAHRYRHFQEIRLVAGSLESYNEEMSPNQLVITPACREDVIIATVGRHMRSYHENKRQWEGGLILTGKYAPRAELLKRISSLDIPIIYVPLCSFDVMKMINTFSAKIQGEDTVKVEQAIKTVESHIDFEVLSASDV